jgi:hypothetical protein
VLFIRLRELTGLSNVVCKRGMFSSMDEFAAVINAVLAIFPVILGIDPLSIVSFKCGSFCFILLIKTHRKPTT